MFSTIRKGLGSIFVMILLGLLVASFALWGIGDVLTGGGRNTVATVGETQIDAQSFYAEYQRQLARIEQQAEQAIDPDEARALGLPQRVLAQMIDRAALDEAARRLGLRASDDMVKAAVREIEAFNGLDGRFDRTSFEQILQQNGFRPAQFLDLLEKDLRRQQLLQGLTAADYTPSALADPLFRYRQEVRVGQILSVPASAMRVDEDPTDEALIGFYEASRDAYRRPPYRAVTALFIDPAVIGEAEAITEAEIAAAYEARLADYVKPEQRQLSLLTFDPVAKEAAEAAAARVAQGESLETVAEELTDFTAEELAIGTQSRDALATAYSAPIAEAVFALEQGAVSEPVQSAFGWHLFRVDEILPGQERPLEQVAEELRQDLAAERAADQVYELSRDVEERLFEGQSLERIAEDLDLPLAQAEAIDQRGLGKDHRLVRTTPSLLPVLETAFAMDPAAEPELTDYADGGYAFVRVDAIEEPVVPPFEEVEAQVRAQYLAQERQRLAGLKAEALLERLNAGASMTELSEETGFPFVTTRPIARADTSGASISPAIQSLLFALARDEADIAAAADGDGYLIVRPVEISPGEPKPADPAYLALRNQLATQVQTEALVMLAEGVKRELKVQVNQATLNRVLDGAR